MYQGMKTLGIVLFLSAFATLLGATWYVPDDFPVIQDAIDASSNGDTIVVRPGTYVENIDFLGKSITVMSESGPQVTVIDGNQAGSVVVLSGLVDLSTVLDGFTITNGTGTFFYDDYYGGGICCKYYAGLTSTNTILWHNKAPTAPEIWIGLAPCTFSIDYSDVEDGQSSVYVDPGCTLNWGSNMIDAHELGYDYSRLITPLLEAEFAVVSEVNPQGSNHRTDHLPVWEQAAVPARSARYNPDTTTRSLAEGYCPADAGPTTMPIRRHCP